MKLIQLNQIQHNVLDDLCKNVSDWSLIYMYIECHNSNTRANIVSRPIKQANVGHY